MKYKKGDILEYQSSKFESSNEILILDVTQENYLVRENGVQFLASQKALDKVNARLKTRAGHHLTKIFKK